MTKGSPFRCDWPISDHILSHLAQIVQLLIFDSLGDHGVDLADVQIFHRKKFPLKLQDVLTEEVFEEAQHLLFVVGQFQHFLTLSNHLLRL